MHIVHKTHNLLAIGRGGLIGKLGEDAGGATGPLPVGAAVDAVGTGGRLEGGEMEVVAGGVELLGPATELPPVTTGSLVFS